MQSRPSRETRCISKNWHNISSPPQRAHYKPSAESLPVQQLPNAKTLHPPTSINSTNSIVYGMLLLLVTVQKNKRKTLRAPAVRTTWSEERKTGRRREAQNSSHSSCSVFQIPEAATRPWMRAEPAAMGKWHKRNQTVQRATFLELSDITWPHKKYFCIFEWLLKRLLALSSF